MRIALTMFFFVVFAHVSHASLLQDNPTVQYGPLEISSGIFNYASYGQQYLSVNNGAKMFTEGKSSFADVALGSNYSGGSNNSLNIGVDSKVQNVHSGRLVTIRNRGAVLGDLYSPVTPEIQDGGFVQGNTNISNDVGTFTMSLDMSKFITGGDRISLGNNTVRELGPGNYEEIMLYSGATLKLSAGEYYCNRFVLEPGAYIDLSKANGDNVVIYTKNELSVKSNSTTINSNKNLLIVSGGALNE